MRVLKRGIFVLAIIGLVVVYMYCFKFVQVEGQSMSPTYENETTLFVKLFGTPTYDDVVAIYSTTLQEDLCKRVVALEGDSVEIKKGKVYVNDKLLNEPFNADTQTEFPKEKVPKDRVFVLGDNRANSLDSRKLGAIPITNIRAIVVCDLHISYNTLRGMLIVILVLLLIRWLISMVNINKEVQIYNPEHLLDYDERLNMYKTVDSVLDIETPYVVFVGEYSTDIPPVGERFGLKMYRSNAIKQEHIERYSKKGVD